MHDAWGRDHGAHGFERLNQRQLKMTCTEMTKPLPYTLQRRYALFYSCISGQILFLNTGMRLQQDTSPQLTLECHVPTLHHVAFFLSFRPLHAHRITILISHFSRVFLSFSLISVAAYGFWHKVVLANREERSAFYVKYNANKA